MKKKNNIENSFDLILRELFKIYPEISKTRWSKKSDFYTLFIICYKNIENFPLSSEKRSLMKQHLDEFGRELDRYSKSENEEDEEEFDEIVKKYSSASRATTDLGSRKRRDEALAEKLKDIWQSTIS